jgi:alpha-glucosidase
VSSNRFWDRPFVVNLFQMLELPELQDKIYSRHHPETHNVLKEFRQVLDQYPEKTSVGEVNSEDSAIVAAYYGSDNDELHMNFYFALAQCRWKAGAFRRVVEKWEQSLPKSAWPAYTFSNHDIMRAISHYSRKGQEDQRARLLAMMLLTLRGTPFIYYGEEIGMKEAKLMRSEIKDPVGLKWYPLYQGRDGSRTPMQWTAGRNAGFTTAEPWLPVGPEVDQRNVATQNQDPASLLNFYRRMINLRRSNPALQSGTYASVVEGVPADCYFFKREHEGKSFLVALNFSSKKRQYNFKLLSGEPRLLLSTIADRQGGAAIITKLILNPLEGVVLKY